ncbi:DUF1648 domain-containing protein [Oleiharenicola lentus]|uniref:DUF1648 domain-containing protein n=1 Tax=Oleiharenicola lentus TaxID=2508720 RepID=UPI003F674A04
MPRPLQLVFFALLAIAIGSAIWQHGQLPERVATHFNAAGEANGWLSRGKHTGLQIATLLFMTAIFQGIVALNRTLPKEYINIPHRDHWLAPEHAATTHQLIADMVLQLGCSVVAFFIVLFYFVYRANFTTPPVLTLHTWWLVGALLAALVIILARFMLHFTRKPGP